MSAQRATHLGLAAIALAVVLALTAIAADDAPAPGVTTIDAKPFMLAGDRPTVVLFAMAGQDRSDQAREQILAAVKDRPARLLAVVSGENADAAAKQFANGWSGGVATDPEYKLAGQLNVKVWPTTAILDKNGNELAHLPGLPQRFATDLAAWLDFATGKIDRPTLQQRLGGAKVIADDPAQMARRHLAVARRLLDKGLVDQARGELAAGLKLRPNDVALQLELARVLLLADRPGDAMTILDRIDPTTVPAWQLDTVRGRALVALGKWDQASAVLARAVRLNPEPAEAYYALGLVCEHKGDTARAAAAYKAAFQNTPAGRRLLTTPTTQPE